MGFMGFMGFGVLAPPSRHVIHSCIDVFLPVVWIHMDCGQSFVRLACALIHEAVYCSLQVCKCCIVSGQLSSFFAMQFPSVPDAMAGAPAVGGASAADGVAGAPAAGVANGPFLFCVFQCGGPRPPKV